MFFWFFLFILLIFIFFIYSFFFFNDTATTEIYTLSLHDALPICRRSSASRFERPDRAGPSHRRRSEEHTSEFQSHSDLVCRLLLEKKKKKTENPQTKKKKHTKTKNNHTNNKK